MDDRVRWTVKVSKDTDVSLRSFLAQRVIKKGDFSKFIEQAVQKAIFSQTVADVEARNTGVPASEIEASIDAALGKVRADMWGAPSVSKRRQREQIKKTAKRGRVGQA